jgi:hypothetical protein
MTNLIEEIIQTEWNMFQNVENIGGRAACQEDFETFYIMRRSQYDNWSDEMVNLYYDFVKDSERASRNLVAEKYARMMAYTDLHYYNKYLKDNLQSVPVENYKLINEIVEDLICWEEEFAQKYPVLSETGRPIRSEDDCTGFTSMETYARGELETYPTELLKLYKGYVDTLKSNNKSLSEMNQLTMVNLYGYDTIDEAEASLK